MPDLPVPIVIAQDAGPAPAPAGGPAPAPGGSTTAPGAPEAPPSSAPSSSTPWMLFAAIGLILYMMLIRPQSKEKRKREDLLKALKKRDRVVMTSGIHGEIVEINDKTATIEIDDGVRVMFDRAAIWQVEGNPSASPANATPASADAGAKSGGDKTADAKAGERGKGKS